MCEYIYIQTLYDNICTLNSEVIYIHVHIIPIHGGIMMPGTRLFPHTLVFRFE